MDESSNDDLKIDEGIDPEKVDSIEPESMEEDVDSDGFIDPEKTAGTDELESSDVIAIETILREEKDLEKIADNIIEGTLQNVDILRKDTIERFLDFVILKVRTGVFYIPNLAFPTKRITDKEFEEKVVKLINNHLFPDIVLPILKYFARNIHDSDTNLYLAYLITSDEIINSIFNTFQLFKKDIFEPDKSKRTLNVKRVQQFSTRADDRFSSPLDAACRFKYILEFIAFKQNVEHIYNEEMISLARGL